MTIIRPNSIAGITSLTAYGDNIEFYKSDGIKAGLNLDGVNINSTGISTFSGGIELGTGTTISSPASDVFTVSTNGSERVRVGAGGSVGIGTDNLTRKLTISKDSETDLSGIELRVVGGISDGNNDGIFFTQSSDGSTSLASIRCEYKSNGRPGLGFYTRDVSVATESRKVYIDPDGRMTMPYQPCWNVGRSTTQTISNAIPTNIIFNQSSGNNCFLQGGCTLDTSTGRITVPVGGKYLLVASIRTEQTGASTGTNLNFRINGTTLQRYYVGTGSANSGGSFMYINPMPYVASASANDYFEVSFDSVVGTFDLSSSGNTVVRFMGYLVG